MESALINGLVGGVIATIVMTAFMMVLGGDDPPPTALFWATYIGDEVPAAYVPQGMVLHFLYGIGAGGAFGVLIELADLPVTDFLLATTAGLGYGVVLFVVAAVFWMKIVLALEPEPRAVGLFLFFHLIYGVILGAWVSLGILL